MRERILLLGKEKIAAFAGCIYVNYLVYMNGGLKGYSHKQLDLCKKREEERVLAMDIEIYVDSVIIALNREASTTTEKYYQQSFIEWFLK